MTERSSDWRIELRKLKRAVRISWIVNFLILALTVEAAIIFIGLDTSSTNDEIITFLLGSIPLSVLVSALIMTWVTVRSDRIIMSSVSKDMVLVPDGHVIRNIVEEMCVSARLRRVPDVYIARGTGSFNAFAVSDSKGAARVVITEELVNVLDRGELEGVIGHEIAHVASGDSPDMTKLLALSNTVVMISGLMTRLFIGRDSNNKNPLALALVVLSFIFLLVAPLLSAIGSHAMSRKRESRADALSVGYTMNPTGLATALQKIDHYSRSKSAKDQKPFEKVGAVAFFSSKHLRTHPALEDRLNDLRSMGAHV